ncbi:fimbrial protein [Aquitalea sp. LB_tupeE]|uniref:fimbrial protein n=1 Tax=Aquitalea sp. LB_tupeE TaxID=2748078 RepID=UPI0015BB159D|nr:fimbrial protein [Aquitalea sp. LB_tupeE]NWK76800.1 fimbrial protein [Aquitalea sp. LB_tupeE]
MHTVKIQLFIPTCPWLEIIRLILFIYMGLLVCQSTLAGCRGGSWTGSAVAISLPGSITVNNPQNGPLNTPLSDWYVLSSNSIVYCPQGGNIALIPTALQQMSVTSSTDISYSEAGLTYTVFPTNTPGIGYILSSTVLAGGIAYSTYPLTSSSAQTIAQGNVFTDVSVNITVKVRLIKTGILLSNTYQLAQQTLASYAVSTNWAGGSGSVYITGTSLSMQNATCSTSTSDIPVSLPTVTPTQFPTLSSTAGSTPFSIVLNCPSRMNVYMTLTDNSNPAQTSRVICAASGSTAQGLGIQVTRNGTAIALGPDSSLSGNTNQFQVGSRLSGIVSIPLNASYIRTGTVTAGTLQAKATFTMSYQ